MRRTWAPRAARWIAGAMIAGAFVGIATGGCSSSPAPATPAPTACACGVTVTNETARVPCGETACVAGTIVRCDADAGPTTEGACKTDGGKVGSDGSVGGGGDASCKLECNGTHCGPDGCGGMCRCPLGVACREMDNACGSPSNCTLKLGAICIPNSMDSNKCCATFFSCETKPGGSACCSNRLGPCKFSGDCCGTSPLCENGKCQ